jgi:2'-5' RNA ligase
MRMFVALVPPEPVLEDLATFLAPRQEAEPDLRWTRPEQWHVTLAFLPDVADRHLDDLLARLERAARRRTAFTARLSGAGAFPNPARARVLWAGVDCGDALEELRRLATGARAAAAKAGTHVEGGPFHPHLTLARLGRPAEVTHLLRVLDGYRGPEWTAGRLRLVASHLGEGPGRRPRYETVEELPLATP